MSSMIFPSEALILGLCIGEFLPDETGEPSQPFATILRKRLLPVIPSLVSPAKRKSEGRPDYDFSRSLSDVIVDDLRSSVALNKIEQSDGLAEGCDRVEHSLSEAADQCEWVEEITYGQEDMTYKQIVEIRGFFDRQGKDDPRAIQAYLRNVAVENGFGDYFEIGRSFGAVMRPLTKAQMWLQDFVRNMTVEDDPCPTFQLSHFVELQRLEALLKCISDFSLAHDIVKLIEKNSDLDFGLYPTGSSIGNAFRLADDMSAALWQAFGVVLGEVRNQDVLFRRDERQPRIPRELRLGGEQFSDDRIAEAVRNAQDHLQNPRSTPAVTVSQLAFAVEACVKRVCRKELAYPNATDLSAIEQCRRSKDVRIQKFGNVAYLLREIYRHDATHNSDDLLVSRAEATMFVTGVQVLHELTKVLGK